MSGRARRKSRRTLLTAGWLTVAASCLLLCPFSAAADKVPSLASTAQYKAFTAYVEKLDGLVGQPITAAQKTTFEAELTAKEKAAAHKANALFNRSSSKALAESKSMFKEQAAAVRLAEEEELEALKSETTEKLERAFASYRAKLERLANGHRTFEEGAHEHIAALRAKKAETRDVAQKNSIQEQIVSIIGEIAAKRQEESTKRAELKAAFQPQKKKIQAAAVQRETEIGKAAEAKIGKIAKHWKNAYNEKKASLNSKREAQLGYLGAKLEKGRADIETMPAAG
jgi:predicted HicB family RNase H-like nuclease